MVYLFLANGFEEVEALTPVDVLRRLGIDVSVVSVDTGKTVCGAHGVSIVADRMFAETDFSDATAIVLPGGMPGSLNLASHDGLCELVKSSFLGNKLVAAICAAPMVLGKVGILNGKKATIYPGMEDRLIGAVPTDLFVVKDGNIITAQGPAAAFAFSYAIASALVGGPSVEETKKAMLYNRLIG